MVDLDQLWVNISVCHDHVLTINNVLQSVAEMMKLSWGDAQQEEDTMAMVIVLMEMFMASTVVKSMF